jgi:SPP1 family holin
MTIKKETIIRTVVLALALINQVLTAFGVSVIPIEDAQITEFISLAFTIGASTWAWWKNNSFTKEALQADEVLKELKSNKGADTIE